ncbi:MAG: 3'-5' exonuclease [Nanoarchaeota archaeon]
MIVLDTEASGINREINGLWQIGAFELENPKNVFLMESRIDDEDEVHPSALKLLEKTEEELRDKKKISQKELIKKFFDWSNKIKNKNIIAQNPTFDVGFLEKKSTKYGLHDPRVVGGQGSFPLPYRSFDLHAVAQTVYMKIHGSLLMKDDKSDMGLSNVLKMCGIEDLRKKLHNGVVVKEGSAHNALEDAKLTGEAFYRLMYGKNLLPEFKKFPIPDYLKQKILKNKK